MSNRAMGTMHWDAKYGRSSLFLLPFSAGIETQALCPSLQIKFPVIQPESFDGITN